VVWQSSHRQLLRVPDELHKWLLILEDQVINVRLNTIYKITLMRKNTTKNLTEP